MPTSKQEPVWSARDELSPAHPERFGPYLLTGVVGRGGMAVAYRATLEGPHGFAKEVVIKVLLPSLLDDAEFVAMFIAEAKTTALLTHPGIVQIYDFGIIGRTPFLVMEYLNGITLLQLMKGLEERGARLSVDIAVVIITQLCHALGYAHRFHDTCGQRQQIIHGDVSLSNIMVCRDGSAKLLDFGVATVLGEFDFEMSHILKGKVAYLAPEQVNQMPFDRRVDVFAAGIVSYELLTGRRLFAAATVPETIARIRTAQVPPPSRYNPDVSPALDAVVLRALDRDPGARFDSAEEMATALEEATRAQGGLRGVAAQVAALFPEEAQLPHSANELAAAHEAAAPRPDRARPRSVTEVVAPAVARPVPRRARLALIARAMLAVLLGFGVGAAVALARRGPEPTGLTRVDARLASTIQPRAAAPGDRRPPAPPASPMASAPRVASAGSVVASSTACATPSASSTPTAARPVASARPQTWRKLRRSGAARTDRVSPVGDEQPAEEPRVKEGSLLDPFEGESEGNPN